MKLDEILPKDYLKKTLKRYKQIRSLEDLIQVRKAQRFKPGPQAHFGASGGQTGQTMTP